MKIHHDKIIFIQLNKEEVMKIFNWMHHKGLDYNIITNGNLLNNPVGEFYVKLNDFLGEDANEKKLETLLQMWKSFD